MYCLLDGTLVAKNWTDLRNGTINVPINLTEKKVTVTKSLVWTGTFQNGYNSAPYDCTGFTDNSTTNKGLVGTLARVDPWWSHSHYETCDKVFPIYCFEQ